MKILIRSLCLLIAATLLACSDPAADWSQATSQGTAAAYQAFLNKYPNDTHAAEARQRIQTIQDGEAWITAETANSVDSYQRYIAAEPHGANVQAAHNQILALQRAAAWQEAKNAGTAAAGRPSCRNIHRGRKRIRPARSWRTLTTRCSWARTAVVSRPIRPARGYRITTARICRRS